MKGSVTKVAPNTNLTKVNNPIVMTDIDDSMQDENLPDNEMTAGDVHKNDETKGVMMTDGSMISGRATDVVQTDSKDEVEVSEGGQCGKCILFFSIMILLPALVFMFIHLGNNNWKFKIEDDPDQDPKKTIEDILIPSVQTCRGEFLFNRDVAGKFGDDFKKKELVDGKEQKVNCEGPAIVFVPFVRSTKDGIIEKGKDYESLKGLRPVYIDEID